MSCAAQTPPKPSPNIDVRPARKSAMSGMTVPPWFGRKHKVAGRAGKSSERAKPRSSANHRQIIGLRSWPSAADGAHYCGHGNIAGRSTIAAAGLAATGGSVMLKSSTRIIVIATTIGALAACGGSGEVNSTPPPPPEAPPPPPPPPPPPAPPAAPTGPVGLISPEPFAVLAISNSYTKRADGDFNITGPDRATVTLQYRESDGKYLIGLPGFREGELVTTDYSGSFDDSSAWISIHGSNNDVRDGASGRQDAQVFLRWAQDRYNPDWDYSYTSWGSWGDDPDVNGTASSGETGYFVYGIPTTAADVPTTGTATYDALVLGMTDGA
ncbi:MAG TPA: hypothetical protein VHN58_05925, partial [Croceicoccus sp.]|nr:hypothetical protein [Croceicoccus sp.]